MTTEEFLEKKPGKEGVDYWIDEDYWCESCGSHTHREDKDACCYECGADDWAPEPYADIGI